MGIYAILFKFSISDKERLLEGQNDLQQCPGALWHGCQAWPLTSWPPLTFQYGGWRKSYVIFFLQYKAEHWKMFQAKVVWNNPDNVPKFFQNATLPNVAAGFKNIKFYQDSLGPPLNIWVKIKLFVLNTNTNIVWIF